MVFARKLTTSRAILKEMWSQNNSAFFRLNETLVFLEDFKKKGRDGKPHIGSMKIHVHIPSAVLVGD